ncbi:MAG: acyl carrier protein [Helicobacteraceae bacterium]|nr:acyl carrier protein [Helicobacteraceae bacterium]
MDTKERLVKIIQDLRPDIDLSLDTESIAFIEDGILDSFDIITLVSAIDKEFNISIDGNKIVSSNFNTLDSMVKLIEESL